MGAQVRGQQGDKGGYSVTGGHQYPSWSWRRFEENNGRFDPGQLKSELPKRHLGRGGHVALGPVPRWSVGADASHSSFKQSAYLGTACGFLALMPDVPSLMHQYFI